MKTELTAFLTEWERETRGTRLLLHGLPTDSYDFTVDPQGRTLGQLAWHLAEAEAYASLGVAQRKFEFAVKPAHIERPRTIEALAPAFEIVHAEAFKRVAQLDPAHLDQKMQYVDGSQWTLAQLLWNKLLFHLMHHRGQLVLLARLAGGKTPQLHGKTRDQATTRRVAP